MTAGPRGRTRPEVLAPAGDLDALKAALAAGADAVYFGLQEGFNARARAGNFSFANLAETVARIHRAGARAYLAVNTLVFEPELEFVERVLRRAAECGVDALIVQDPAVAVLARELCPTLEVHASTQMTISSPEGAQFARSLGATRIVAPRELSVAELREFARRTDVELEVFIHGALCVAWSGQCLTSEAWGGRSANRGQCAQSCRMPYDLVVDGEVRELGDVKYLLSPKDLAGLRAVEELVDIGVHGLKIEGRQKGPAYVATATEMYRRWVDAVASERGASEADEEQLRRDLLRASLSYTRGFSDGFLGGSDHQTLVEGRFPKSRGVLLGRVVRVGRDEVLVERDREGRPWTGALAAEKRAKTPSGTPASALRGLGGADDASSGPAAGELEPRAGMGVVFDAGRPEDEREAGGPIFAVESDARGWRLRFGRPGPDLARVAPGQRVWVSSDPRIARDAERLVEGDEPQGRIAVELRVRGKAGEPLEVTACALDRFGRGSGPSVELRSETQLSPSSSRGIDEALLRDKLGAFGGTPFRLAALDASELESGLHLPVSELKALRRALASALLGPLERGAPREVSRASKFEALRASQRALRDPRWRAPLEPELVALCRTDEQLEAAIEGGVREVELDWMELVGLGRAVERARAAGLRVTLATVRVQKPGEEGFDRRLAALAPDAVLVRHWGALVHFQSSREAARGAANDAAGKAAGALDASPRAPVLHGDFSLNVTNSITAAELFERGLDTLTPSYDLDRAQLEALLDHADPTRFTLVLYHRIPTFHTEHCVYSHLLSNGRDHRTCGRPCEHHEVSLRDHTQRTHPVIVDVGCRNTVFNSEAQSCARLAPALLARGVRRFRVEFVREPRAEALSILRAFSDLLAARISADEALHLAHAKAHLGVSNAPMALMER
jgi:putative protease